MTAYSPATASLILERIANGQSLRKICTAEGMPSRETFRRWLRDDQALRAQYAQAREDQADAFADEIIELAATAAPQDTQRAKLMVDTRKWLMSKMAPKRYGEKVTHAGDPDAPLVPTGPDDLARRLAFLFTKAVHEKERQEAEDLSGGPRPV